VNTFIDGHDQPNDLWAWSVERSVEGIAANQTTKQSIVTGILVISVSFLFYLHKFMFHILSDEEEPETGQRGDAEEE
jgi:hypothetical protein